MKSYPSIEKQIRPDTNIYAFYKLDGSNIRAEFSKKKGFYKFGTRHRMLGEDDPMFGESIGLIRNTYEEGLAKVFNQNKVENAVCFFEFYGLNSFAGHHVAEPHQVTLFDVNLYKKGFQSPGEFLDMYGHLGVPEVLYYGKANTIFVESVRNSTLEGLKEADEGVICKGNPDKRGSLPVMFKIKTRGWLQKLKTFCKDDEKLFDQLA